MRTVHNRVYENNRRKHETGDAEYEGKPRLCSCLAASTTEIRSIRSYRSDTTIQPQNLIKPILCHHDLPHNNLFHVLWSYRNAFSSTIKFLPLKDKKKIKEEIWIYSLLSFGFPVMNTYASIEKFAFLERCCLKCARFPFNKRYKFLLWQRRLHAPAARTVISVWNIRIDSVLKITDGFNMQEQLADSRTG